LGRHQKWRRLDRNDFDQISNVQRRPSDRLIRDQLSDVAAIQDQEAFLRLGRSLPVTAIAADLLISICKRVPTAALDQG
jgi:hypothetical protein